MMQTPQLMQPIERVIELARAKASDVWAARRGYTARSLEPVVARVYDSGLMGRPGVKGKHPQHFVYESVEEAALALQDFLFAHQNRLARGRVLGGTAPTRPLPVRSLQGGNLDRSSSRRVDIDVDLAETLYLGRGPVPL